jgi:integrase/recombinase XerD
MVNPTHVPVSGPLAEFGSGFASELLQQGYKTNPAGLQMNLMAHLSCWLADEGLDVRRLSDTEVERYLRVRRSAGLVNHCGSRAMRPILAYLHGLGVVPTPSITLPEGPVEVVLERYRRYLTVDRGLAPATARGYIYAVRPFLCGRILPDGHDLNLEHLGTVDITTFIVACCAHRSRGTAKRTVTALRSLLRFLHVKGIVKRSLVGAVPSIARWHLAGLPKSLEPAQVHSLLSSCDRRTQSGRRDFAILTLLVRLGLRAGEVAALALDDIDWRAGEMVVHGKGKRADRLPLPTDVGEAIVAYLRRGRLANAEVRSVFVRINAPHHALSTSGVAHVVTSTARRAGLGHIHAHRLRHTVATQLLRAGASLPEIGQLLRHRRVLTTAIYAKVDREALRRIARPWPGGVE